jgi:hypothetical protein
LLLQAVLLWQLATLAKTDAARVRPLIASFAVAQVASGFLAWKYIFAIPVIFSAVVALCLAAAFVAASRRPAS